jgi:hypothetical protein
MVRSFSELSNFLNNEKAIGCFVDTTILFSATYHLDSFNSESEIAFDLLADAKVPPFTNINVRAEFLESHRRILIPEGLSDFLEDFQSELDGSLLEKLKANRTSYRKKISDGKSAKMDVNQIKNFRLLLGAFQAGEENGWDLFCRHYLHGKLEPIWPETQETFDLNFISIRSEDENEFLSSTPRWEQAVSLMGRYGIASSDAMILNMFLCSKIPVLLTADLEMAEVADKESQGKKAIFTPGGLMNIGD